MRLLLFVAYFIIAFLCLQSCEDPNQSRIPYVPVQMNINLSVQYPTFKDVVNDTLVFTKPRLGYEYQDRIGYGGILAIVGIGNNGTAYYAYDLCCPYEADPAIRVYPNDAGTASCKVCGSEFYITDGWGRVSKGPSKWSLKRYTVSYQQTPTGNMLLIRN